MIVLLVSGAGAGAFYLQSVFVEGDNEWNIEMHMFSRGLSSVSCDQAGSKRLAQRWS